MKESDIRVPVDAPEEPQDQAGQPAPAAAEASDGHAEPCVPETLLPAAGENAGESAAEPAGASDEGQRHAEPAEPSAEAEAVTLDDSPPQSDEPDVSAAPNENAARPASPPADPGAPASDEGQRHAEPAEPSAEAEAVAVDDSLAQCGEPEPAAPVAIPPTQPDQDVHLEFSPAPASIGNEGGGGAEPGLAQQAVPAPPAEAEFAGYDGAPAQDWEAQVAMEPVADTGEPAPVAGETSDAELKAVIEGIVYITEEPVTVAQIANALQQPEARIRQIVEEIVAEFEEPRHGLAIREIAGGFKMATKPEHHEAIRDFVRSLKPPLKLSLAALETLATIAYKQPITAPEIMEIRGVQGTGVLKTLLDRKLIMTAGRKNVVGRPMLYKTTKEFLVQFGLRDLSELPSLKEFEELKRLAFNDDMAPTEAAPEQAGADLIPLEQNSDEPPTEPGNGENG